MGVRHARAVRRDGCRGRLGRADVSHGLEFRQGHRPRCRQADADRRAAVPYAHEVLVGRRHSGFERGLHRHHDAPDPAPHRHGLRRGLVRQAVHGRDLPFHVRPDALADGAGLVPKWQRQMLRNI